VIITTGKVLVNKQGQERWVNPNNLTMWQNSGWTIVDTMMPEAPVSAILRPVKSLTEQELSQNTNKENE
jgi:hypothetical protein